MKKNTYLKANEILPEIFSKSELMILDFHEIPTDLPMYKNIKMFFERSLISGLDPRLPANRQAFNDEFLMKSDKRYLIGRYAENRIEMLRGSRIADEGRTIHLGIDIFSKNLEPIYAPCNGEIISVGREEGNHTFGNYLIFKPDSTFTGNYIFLGHLSKKLPKKKKVYVGEEIATMGDWINDENGGWSRHLHLQLLRNLPEVNTLPIGYSTERDLDQNRLRYPDPTWLISNTKESLSSF